MSKIKVSEMPPAGTLTGAEIFPIVQDGANKNAELGDLRTLISVTGDLAYDSATGVISLTGAGISQGDNISLFNNDAGYLTSEANDLTSAVTWANVPDSNITQSSVTQHETALSITESQITDLKNYLTSETTTAISFDNTTNTLSYTDETASTTNIDLSLYLDDTNLARLTSGTVNSSGVATFTRDDATTFTVDFSSLFDDTNLSRITSAGFNSTNGTLTLTRDDASTVTADLDGRYLTDYTVTESDVTQHESALSITESQITDLQNYLTDYTVTQGDVTQHESALSITESQITDLQNYLTSETTTAISFDNSTNTLSYTDETATTTDIDLSLYLDDTNLARLTSGTLDGSTGIATFTRDDNTTFTIDFSPLFDDTNLARITSASFNDANGVLTLTRDDASTVTADLDGRYLTNYTVTESDVTQHESALSITESQISNLGSYITLTNLSVSGDLSYDSSTGEFSFTERTDSEVRNLLSVTGDLLYNSTTGVFSVTTYKSADFNTDFGNKSTDDLSEGTTNLYYTDSRVDSHLVGGSGIDYNAGTISHSDTSSVSNVSAASNTFVDAVSFDDFGHVTSISTSTAAPPNDATITVSAGTGLNGGGNFTTDQSGNETISLDVDTSTIATRSYVDTEVANLVDSSPSTLDTLNELAAALGDDPNFATTVANDIGDKADKTIDINAGSGLTGGGDLSANRTISHGDTSSQSSVNGSGSTFIQDVTLDEFGHVTGLGTATVTATANDATITVNAGSGLSGGGNFTTDQATNETITIDHANTSSQSDVNNSGGTVIQDINVDTYGHITSIGSKSLSPGDVGALPSGGKAADSDLLDGLNSSQFLRSDTSATMSGRLEMADVLDMNNNDIFGVDQILHHNDANTFIQFPDEDEFRIVTGGLERFLVTNTNITSSEPINAPDFNSTSDERLKESIETIENGLDVISQIRPVSFDWKGSGEKSFGVIAQEIEQILPQVVATNDEGMKSVAYDKIIAFLIDAVKTLDERTR